MNAHKPYNREAGRPLEPASTGAAEGCSPVPSVAPTFVCRNCDGSGQSEYMGLNEDRYHWRTCWDCDGSGVEEPYCGCCQGPLTADLYCADCEASEQLVFVERIAPGSIAA